ncbi:MAG TPA: adenylate/guanylate cyclase domain-containing protein [Candidatus Dormibacteraeota bacterium]|nr:adenylate/guanylate cyclase domain-containing protein [Candidatus Dormibacteraeota bacterium]
MIPTTRYARSGEVNIAYQVVGSGPNDLVFVPGWVSQVEAVWEEPTHEAFLRRLASFSRLILFDKRGTGLSDRVSVDRLPTLEDRMDDVRAVMDAAGSQSAALFGVSEGGVMCALFAATYPERTKALVLYGSYPRRLRAPDYPWGPTEEERADYIADAERQWGGPAQLDILAPSAKDDERLKDWFSRYLRASASPGAATALLRMNSLLDIRPILPTIRVPTLILHRTGDLDIDVNGSRYMAQQIPGARYVELPGSDHLWFVGDSDAILDEVEEFLTGVRHRSSFDRVLATVMFTDIAGSTEIAATIGDTRWRALLETHAASVRRSLQLHHGQEIDNAGDGFLARFDGPARAIRCALAIVADASRLDLGVRAGIHTGECEEAGGKLRGIAVHIAARVMAAAQPGEVMVSSTVHDLVAGSGLTFTDAGLHRLKGVPGEWQVFKVRQP